jgi:hypothetical protein
MTTVQLIPSHFRAFPVCMKGLIIGLRIRDSRENRAIKSPNHRESMGSVCRYWWKWKKTARLQNARKKTTFRARNSLVKRLSGRDTVNPFGRIQATVSRLRQRHVTSVPAESRSHRV